MTDKQAKIMWITAIVAMGLTATMNLLGGIGTVCAAFFTKDYPPMWDLYDYRWLYQRMMFITIVIGLAGIWTTMRLFRGGPHAYRNALAILAIGTIIGELHVTASIEFRGKAVPANMKFYSNMFTLILFLMLSLPTIGRRIDFSKPAGKTELTAAGGLASIIIGITLLTIGIWAGPSHTYEGVNWTDVLQPHLSILGIVLTLSGLAVMTQAMLKLFRLPENVALVSEVQT